MVAEKSKATAGAEAVEKSVKSSKDTVHKAMKAGHETVEKAVKTGTDAFAKSYEQYLSATKDQLTKLFPSAAKNFDELAAFNKGNFEAFVAAGTAAAKGFETLSQQVIACNQKAVETGVATAKALLGCKTLQDVVEVQTDLTRKGIDEWLAEGTKLSELTVKVANEAVEPINSRLSEAVDRFMKPLAA
jgi:phasin family protein